MACRDYLLNLLGEAWPPDCFVGSRATLRDRKVFLVDDLQSVESHATRYDYALIVEQ